MLLPWVVPAARRALQNNANSPLDWVDSDFAPRRQYDAFCDDFGAADSVIMSWPGCRLDDARLDRFVASLRGADAFRHDGEPLFHHVTSGRETIAAMAGPPLSIPYDEAVRRWTGSIVGPDGQTTCVVIGFSAEGVKQRSRLVPLIRAAATHYCDAPYHVQHLAGPIMDGHAVDSASQATMGTLAPLSSLVVLLVCFLCLESIAATLLVFGVSIFCQAVTFAAVDLSGGTMTALLVVLPPLVQVLAIAGGIHFVNYYFDACETTDRRDAVARAFQVAWLPCVLSAATTAIGIGSLSVSGLVAVREFGIYAAFGVLITVAILLTTLFGFLQWFPLNRPRVHGELGTGELGAGGSGTGKSGTGEVWLRLASWQQRHWGWVCVAALLAMVGLGVGVTRLSASVRIETLFADESRLIRDYAWLEEHVGPLVPIEVVTTFDSHHGLTASERLDHLKQMEQRMRSVSHVESVVSALNFLPSSLAVDDDLGDQVGAVAKGFGERFNFHTTDRDGSDKWRTTAYVSALGQNDYIEIMNEMTAALGDDLSPSGHDPSNGGDGDRARVDVQISGLMPLVHDIQQQLLRDLYTSFLTAFALIAVVMTIVQAGIVSGLLSMIPNVFPAVTLFGILGWMGRPLDIGSIMTASVAMGIAVDDTLHFLTFYQRELSGGRSRIEAIRSSYLHCGRAMIQTTLICGSGIAIFGFSDFIPTSGFAWMTVLLLVAALLGDLIVLPALLLSPLAIVPSGMVPSAIVPLKSTASPDTVEPEPGGSPKRPQLLGIAGLGIGSQTADQAVWREKRSA